jgi:2-dehydro-3-deoxygalactonokinase
VSRSLVVGDWGSSRLRLWRIEAGRVADRRQGPGILAASPPAESLASALGDWTDVRIVLGGMAGAREGLHQVPYLACPVSSADWRERTSAHDFRGSRLRIAAGLSCRDAAGRPEVMRGEECQIFGAMALDPALATGRHRVLLPGTHSKWAWLEDGLIVRFRTCMTGELFALLGRSSLFAAAQAEDDDADGFAAGLDRADRGESLSCALFEARAAQLLDGRSAGWAQGFVSGLLIGADVAEADPEATVVTIADPALAERYEAALARRERPMRRLDGETCAIAGLRLLDADG